MNDQILLKLAEQAGFENGHQDRDGRSLAYELEKFAELIVRECLDQCAKIENDCELGNYDGGDQSQALAFPRGMVFGSGVGALLCANEIKEHFGVVTKN